MKRALIALAVSLAGAGASRADSISIAPAAGRAISIATFPSEPATNAPWAGRLRRQVNDGAYAGLSVLASCVDIYQWAGWTENVTVAPTSNGHIRTFSGGDILTTAHDYLDDVVARKATSEALFFLGSSHRSLIPMVDVAEPASLLLFGTGLIGCGVVVRRKVGSRK